MRLMVHLNRGIIGALNACGYTTLHEMAPGDLRDGIDLLRAWAADMTDELRRRGIDTDGNTTAVPPVREHGNGFPP